MPSPTICSRRKRRPTHTTAGSRETHFLGTRLCIEKIVFRRQTFAPQRKSGGRQPPVVPLKRARSGQILHKRTWRRPPVVPQHANATAIGTYSVRSVPNDQARVWTNVFTDPGRADARRSWLRIRSPLNKVRLLRCILRITNHGSLTPAAPGWAFDSRWTMFDSRGTACGSPTYGRLTPAALVHVRVCTANGVIYRRTDVVHPRAAGVSQPCYGSRLCRANIFGPPQIAVPMSVSGKMRTYGVAAVRTAANSGSGKTTRISLLGRTITRRDSW